jgi:hypothetical protein
LGFLSRVTLAIFTIKTKFTCSRIHKKKSIIIIKERKKKRRKKKEKGDILKLHIIEQKINKQKTHNRSTTKHESKIIHSTNKFSKPQHSSP